MRQENPARLMRIHISESDRFGDKPLYEAIVARCRELKIAGATMLPDLIEEANRIAVGGQPALTVPYPTAHQVAAVECRRVEEVLALLDLRRHPHRRESHDAGEQEHHQA